MRFCCPRSKGRIDQTIVAKNYAWLGSLGNLVFVVSQGVKIGLSIVASSLTFWLMIML
jgi:hypothetical protein